MWVCTSLGKKKNEQQPHDSTSVTGVLCLRLPHLTLLNLDATRVRAEAEETLRAHCPELTRVSLLHIDPVSAVDEETDNW